MRKGTVFLIAAITALLGLAGGYFLYANTVARFDAVSSVCVTLQEAVNQQLLTIEQVRDIGTAAGSTLKSQYSSVAEKLRIPEQGAANASEQSVCSQFLAGVHAAH